MKNLNLLALTKCLATACLKHEREQTLFKCSICKQLHFELQDGFACTFQMTEDINEFIGRFEFEANDPEVIM